MALAVTRTSGTALHSHSADTGLLCYGEEEGCRERRPVNVKGWLRAQVPADQRIATAVQTTADNGRQWQQQQGPLQRRQQRAPRAPRQRWR